jgi:hypothetical protein
MSQSPRARQSPLEKAEESVAYWRAELAQVERERRGMVWALRVGVPLGALIALVAHPLIGIGLIGMSILTWALGLYMTTVRRGEFKQRLRDAEEALAAARGVS